MPRRSLIALAVVIFLSAVALQAAVFPDAGLARILFSAGIVFLVVATPLALFVQRQRRSLKQLTLAAQQITAGNYEHRVYGVTSDDMHELARHFNTMSEQLAQRFADVDEDRHQLQIILGGMVEGVVAVDRQQRIDFVNERAAQLLEFHPVTSVGRKFWEVVRQRPILGAVERALNTGIAERDECDWKGNPAKSLVVYVSPLAREPGGAIIVVHDISDLRRLERLRHEFVANVSHELKTPLAVIKAAVETLQDGAVDDLAHRGEFLEQIRDQAQRLNSLILDLLSLARIESGSVAMDIVPVNIADAVDECVARHQSRADAKKQTIEVQRPTEPSAAEMRTDEESFAQILDNLVDNAIKYTPEGSVIQIRWFGRGDQICLEVEDNGPGIPEDDLPRVFERFYRVDKARSRELGGTGLGLAIVKNLAHILRGKVSVASTLGKGTTFTVSLPRTPS